MVYGSSCLGQNNIRPRFGFTHGVWAFASMVGLLLEPIGLEKKTPSTFYLYALCLCPRFSGLRKATKVTQGSVGFKRLLRLGSGEQTECKLMGVR